MIRSVRDDHHGQPLNIPGGRRPGYLEEVLAGNEEHPFASIVAAYHESQPPALDTDESATEPAPAYSPAPSEEPVAESVPAEPPAGADETAADEVEPTTEEPVAESVPTEPPAGADETAADEVEPTTEEPVEAPTEEPAPVVAAEAEALPDPEKPSALVDPFKSILAAYYAQSIEVETAPKVEPEPPPAAEQPNTAMVDASVAEPPPPVDPAAGDPQLAVAEVAEPPAAPIEEPAPAAEAATAEAAEDTVAVEGALGQDAPAPPVAPPTGAWGRHAVPAEASGAAASVLAAYYAGSPETPDEAQAVEPEPTAATEVAATEADATAVLPVATEADFRDAPSNPLGSRAATGGWGAQALAAAGSTDQIEPGSEALPAAVQHRATEFIDNSPEPDEKDTERSEARRKFLMLAPIAAIAALAVLAVLLWNGHKSTPKPAPSPTTTPSIILDGSPLKRTQEAYVSVLTRFNNANDSGGAVVAGGAAHDTLKLMKDFKGATAQDKALLAAERAHLTSLSGLATASPSSFGGAAGQAKRTLAAVQKAALADPKAKAPNSSTATAQAIDLLGEGNVTKLQVALNGLIGRADSASLTSQLRGIASEAAGNADSANSLASVIKNPTVQTTASALANKFSSMGPMARLSGDTLSDWSNIRPGMVAALGLDPVTHIDSLIANAQQKLASWAASQSNQSNNASVTAINTYANAMRSHFGSFGSALSQIPSLNPGESCSAGAKDGTRSRAGNAALAVNNAAFGGNPPAALVGAHNALVNAINSGTVAATAAQNVTVLCTTRYGAQSNWGTYTSHIWVKGGWGGQVGAWESAVSQALKNASASPATPKPVV